MPKSTYTRALLAGACALAFALPAHAQDAAQATEAEDTNPNVKIGRAHV